ncbi:MAG TPA: DivIVA domain-containing protein [Mycobacteriales bacterium]|nr:DivIVA domain-containing protein [Mycobacteriales bacterium]
MRDVLIVLVVLAVAAVLFFAAVVATQDTAVLADAPPDGPDVELPAGRVVAEDLRAVRFGMVVRGYRMSEVDDVLVRLGEELAERDSRIADLEQVLAEIVEPAVQEAEARQAIAADDEPASVDEAPEPVVAGALEPGLPPSLAPPLARGARDGEAPPEAPASDAEDVAAADDVMPPVAAEPTEEPEPAPAGGSPAWEEASPLDPGWEPSLVERTLDLAASYRVSMPGGPPPVVVPAAEPEAPVGAAPEPLATSETVDDDGFPEVTPAEPAEPWAPEAVEDTGDDARAHAPEQPRPAPEP